MNGCGTWARRAGRRCFVYVIFFWLFRLLPSSLSISLFFVGSRTDVSAFHGALSMSRFAGIVWRTLAFWNVFSLAFAYSFVSGFVFVLPYAFLPFTFLLFLIASLGDSGALLFKARSCVASYIGTFIFRRFAHGIFLQWWPSEVGG